MPNQSSTSNDKQLTIQDIIHEIEKKSKGGGYIYRGERKCNPKVSSKLYRDFEIETGNFNIELVQKEMLAAAKKHTGDLPQDFRLDVPGLLKEERKDLEILTEIQHYDGKTNLIDFTTDYFIALFFACDGRYDEDGRVILQKMDEIRSIIAHPRNPRHRVIVQKSIFIRPPRGFIKPHKNDIVTISANLKQPLLQHLRDYHGISTEFIYNDLHGFIKNQNIHGEAYTHFYRGLACQNRANEASTRKEKHREYEEAIKHYTEAIKLKPDLGETYNNRGNAYYKKKELDKAISDYNTAIKLNPDDAEAYNNRGNAYQRKSDSDLAIQDYTQAIQLKPDYAEAHNNRGAAHGRKGDFDQAIRDYTQAIQLNLDYAEAYYNRGNAYQEKGDFDQAIQDYTQATQLKPDYANAYNNRGNTYQKKGDFDRAIQDYIQVIRLKPDLPEAYNNRGNAYQKKGELDQAIQDYIQAIQLKPDYAEAHNNRGVAYGFKGDFDQAIRDYTQAIQLEQNYANAYRNRGEAWLRLQEWEKAKVDLTIARDLGMDIIAKFHSAFGSFENFERINGIPLPADIVALLTPS